MLPLKTNPDYMHEYGLLYRCLKWLCLLSDAKVSAKKKVLNFFLHLSVFVIYADYLCMCIVNFSIYFTLSGAYLPYLLPNSVSVLTFYVFAKRKEKIMSLLQLLQLKRITKPASNVNKKFLFIIFLDAFYCVTFIAMSFKEPLFLVWYAYKMENSIYFKYCIAIVRFCAHSFLNPFLIHLVSLLYCELCRRCTVILRYNRFAAESLLFRQFSKKDVLNQIQNRRKAMDIINTFQNTFSLFATFICFATISCCFSVISYFLNYKAEYPYPAIYESIFYFFVPLINLLFIVECASAVPREMQCQSEVHSKIAETEIFEKISTQNSNMARNFLREPKVTLSASELFFFTRKISLSVIGSMLTYSLLLVNFLFNKKA